VDFVFPFLRSTTNAKDHKVHKERARILYAAVNKQVKLEGQTIYLCRHGYQAEKEKEK
jgi:hypothetical protein